ncbi:hypothetical protein NIA73_10545 [Anaerobutyricum hallii]|mgnify:CR=1 FL=1|nr:hypothetical protein [Anaerobutyricum hallii]
MNKLKKKKAGIKDFFKGKHGRNFLLALDVLLAIAFLHSQICIMIHKLRIFLIAFMQIP